MFVRGRLRMLTAALVLTPGMTFTTLGLTVSTANADCTGTNDRTVVSVDPISGGEIDDVMVDSCHAQDLVNAYETEKDAAGLAAALGAKWWPVGVAAGIFYGWAWANQDAVKDCAKAGTGIKFREINGIVTECSPQ